MKTLVAAFVTALVVFTLSTVWSEAVQPGMNAIGPNSSTHGVNDVQRLPAPADSHHSNEQTNHDRDRVVGRSESNSKSPRNSVQETEKNPVADQIEQVKLEEARLAERQNTIELIYRDIFREIETLKEIRRRSAIELAAAEKRANESASIQASAIKTTTIAEKTANRSTTQPKSNGGADRRMAILVQGLVDRGNARAAVALLAGLKERESTKVLSLLKDSQTATRLADQLRTAAADPAQQF